MLVVDAHEDIGWNGVALGRDVRRSALETRRVEAGVNISAMSGLCMVGLPEWLAGEVAVVFGTIFVAPARKNIPPQFTYSNAEEAHRLGQEQVAFYRRLADQEERVALVETLPDLERVLHAWEDGSPQVGLVMLMEGADPIRTPAEAAAWFEQGVRMIALSWAAGSRYAGGNSVPGPLTDAGRELLAAMDDLGMTLDISHLAEEAFFEALDRFSGRVIASHSNPRARVPGPRQLSDEMIRRLVERDGVIGVVLYNRFLRADWRKHDPKTAVTLDDVVAAVDHICQVAGDARHVGLGSDFDGGFGAESAPAGLDTVADLRLIGPALADHGYGDAEVAAILGGNWLRVLRETLPKEKLLE